MLEAGRVGRPHGLDGSFYVTRPVPELLAAGTPVQVAGGERRVERRAGSDEQPIVRLAGCRVVDRDNGVEVGVVERMVALPSCEALEVGERLIPLVRGAIRSIDPDARVIDVDLRFVDG